MNALEDVAGRVRLDKWLWAARFYKTRTLAARAVDAGAVRLDGERTKPAKEIRVDDILEIRHGAQTWTVRVRLLSDVRRSAGIAQTLYAETETSRLARQASTERARLYREPALGLKGRPNRRQRRVLSGLGGE